MSDAAARQTKHISPAAVDVMLTEQAKRVAEIDRQRGLAEAAEAAKGRASPVSFVDCRIFGHAWESTEADRNPTVGWYMKLRCVRCGTERADVVDRYGTVMGRQYHYPESYKDTDRWSRNQWRMQYLRRLK
jgi:hypothetical protein